MLYLMSTTVIPSECVGTWEVTPLSLGAAQDLVRRHQFTSAVGHASTAEAMTALLGIEVPMDRQTIAPEEGDYCLCFKLKKRPPEGAILDLAQLQELGHSWCVMHYVKAAVPYPVDVYRIGEWDSFPDYIRWERSPAEYASN